MLQLYWWISLPIFPNSPEDLASALAQAAAKKQSIRIYGGDSKRIMGGPISPAETEFSTSQLSRVLAYEPSDLTISVEAGMPIGELNSLLAAKGQMLPLDPPFTDTGSVAGTLAASLSGPRRRLYGSARDLIIGMKYATLEGKLVQSGGMVVKNVAGLDTAKLMVGSWGTLAAIAVVNFKVLPKPACSKTFLLEFDSVQAAILKRNGILTSVLQPAAIDMLNPAAAARLGLSGFVLAVQAVGSAAVVARYSAEFAGSQSLDAEPELALWNKIREFAPNFMAENPQGLVARILRTLEGIEAILKLPQPTLVRAGAGVCYAAFNDPTAVLPAGSIIEYSAEQARNTLPLWPAPGIDFKLMQNLKGLFDPNHLLNQGRLYGRI